MSTGNRNVNEGRVSSKWLECVGKGSEWSPETLSSVASFMRQMLTGAFECQAR